MKPKNPGFYLWILMVTSISVACSEMDGEKSPGSWRRLKDFPGEGSNFAVTFSLEGKGYWAGSNSSGFLAEVWAYSPATDSWEQKKTFPYTERYAEAAAVADNRAFVLMSSGRLYEYHPAPDEWTFVSSFPPGSAGYLVGFALGDNAYFGTGSVPDAKLGSRNTSSFWKYNPTLNSWTQIEDFRGAARMLAISFVVDNNAYVGGGFIDNGGGGSGPPYLTDFYRYDGQTQTWNAVAHLPDDSTVGFIFASATRGYVGIMRHSNLQDVDIFEFNPERDRWRKMNTFPGRHSLMTKSFFLNDRIFIVGSGWFSGANRQVWEFGP